MTEDDAPDRLDDFTAERILNALLELAIAVRDLGPNDVRNAAQAALDAARGDAHAAITLAAALIPVDKPVDTWWQRGPAHRQARDGLARLHGVSTDVPCERPGHRTLRAHDAADQKPCRACLDFQAAYRRGLRARKGTAA
jgi:hypothetical protein